MGAYKRKLQLQNLTSNNTPPAQQPPPPPQIFLSRTWLAPLAVGFTAKATHEMKQFPFIVLNKLTGAIAILSATFQLSISFRGLNGQFE